MAQFKAQMLWESIKKGDLTAVHGLLESGNINLEERDETGRTFLMVASEKGELNIVRELLEAGVDPNAVDNESWSALLCASKEGYLEIVIELLEHGAELEHKDMCGWTSLMWASYKGRITVVQELLDRGAHATAKADHHMTSLAWASGRGHTEIVQMLISKGAKVNTADKYGTTPLIWACRKGYNEIVDSLLAEGANVDASGMHSWTPLLVATKGGHAEVVNSLLQHDPNVNATDKDGQTSLAIAAREGHVDIVKDLLSKGAYVNVPDRGGDSILIHAVKGGQLEVVKALLDKYVDVDVQGAEGKTALYWAVEKGYNETVKLLLASEPDLEICTKDEDTALLRAVRSRNEECVRMLLEKGAKVSASDKRGDTALHIAIRARSKRITEVLLRNPRNSRLLYRPNKSGETPYAMDAYHQRGILQGIYGHRNLNASDAENLLGYDIYSSALADILSDPSLGTPITVGLYAKWGSGKSFLINKLQSEMKSFTQQNEEEHFSLTLTLVLLMLFLSLVVGEALVLGVSLTVGLGVAAAIFVMQLVFCGAVMLCDRRYDMKYAVRISMVLGRRQRMMMLLLRMLFCNPRRAVKADRQSSNQYSVRFLFSDCTRLTSVAGEKALAAMIATLCQAVEREYGFVVTRLFRVFKPADNNQKKGRFKSLCCVPYFLFVLLVLFCIAAGVALLVQFRIKQHIAVDGILIAIASILTLTLVGNIYTWAQTIMALVSSQKRRVLKAADQVDSLKMDGFLQRLKQEVELMSHMIRCMDAFTADQTRLVVIVDGLDTCEQDKVLQVLDTVKSLFSDDNSPFITILAVDPHIIIKGIEHNLKSTFQDSNVNGFDYLRNVVHLPFYLQTQGLRIQHQESIHDDRERTAPKLGHQESTTSVESKREARRKGREGLSGSQPQMFSSSFDLSNTFARSDYFSDINPRSMRRLMNIVSVTARLLRAYNIDFKWHRLAAWINIIEQWPYRVSWIIYLFEEQNVVESSVSLYALYQRILPRIPMTKESEPLLEIDRNARKLEAFLSSQSPSLPRLNVADLRKFLPCTINLDPYLRKLIRETEHQNELRQESSLLGGGYLGSQTFPPPPPPLPSSGPSFSDSLSLGLWNRPTPQGSSPSRYLGPQPPVVTVQNPSVTGSMGLLVPAPSASFTTQGSMGLMPGRPSRPHPAVFFNDVRLLSQWAELDVEGVCNLLGALKGVTAETLVAYTKSAKENNISGLVLQNCDLDELRPVLEMRFGDWQLFKSAILSLREWNNCLCAEDSSGNASHSSTSTSLPTSSVSPGEMKNIVTDSRQAGAKPVQGRVVGPKGRRMRRNDSIVQQLSYEAAILHEALEEFSEESDGNGDDVVVEDLQLDSCAPSPLTGGQAKDEAAVMASLSSLITVLDAPSSQSGSGEGQAQAAPPYLLQSSFPSSAQFSEVVQLVSPTPEEEQQQQQQQQAAHSQSHKHHSPLLKSLSTGLEKIARPFIHAFDGHHHAEGHPGIEDGAGGGADRLASSGWDKVEAAGQRGTPVSAWDRRTFSQDSSCSAEARDRPVSIEMAPATARPVFSVGSEENSPTHPDFRVEREVTNPVERTRAAPSAPSTAQQPHQGQSGPWQHRAQVAPDDLLFRNAGPSPDKDKESFV